MEQHLRGRDRQLANEVLLWNHVAGSWDLVYRYDYAATSAQQASGWVGSWGPIVETFQNPYSGTSPMGAATTMLIARGANGAGADASLRGSSESYVRTDGVGFHLCFREPNYRWAVNS